MRPARLLAPAALVVAAIALFSILASGGSDDSSGEKSASPAATATAEPKAKKTPKPKASQGGTYTVKAGDTPSGIAEKLNIDVDDLLEANPDADPDALTVGDKLELP